MNKPIYLGFSILEVSKTVMYEFWYDYIKPKYVEIAKLLYRHRQLYHSYSFLIDDFEEKKKNKGTKKCVLKGILKFNDYKDCLLNKKIILKSQQRFKSEAHSVYTEEINKVALRSNDDKRVWASDGVTSYPYG